VLVPITVLISLTWVKYFQRMATNVMAILGRANAFSRKGLCLRQAQGYWS